MASKWTDHPYIRTKMATGKTLLDRVSFNISGREKESSLHQVLGQVLRGQEGGQCNELQIALLCLVEWIVMWGGTAANCPLGFSTCDSCEKRHDCVYDTNALS